MNGKALPLDEQRDEDFVLKCYLFDTPEDVVCMVKTFVTEDYTQKKQ